MNKLYYILFCLLMTMFACDNSEIVDSDPKRMTRSGAHSFSLFKDIESYTLPNGNNSISGKIYCTEKAEYTFIFAFDGTNGCRYEAAIGTNFQIYPTNGNSFRTISTILQPGVHDCFVKVSFNAEGQQGYARLAITKINNVSPNIPDGGCADLVAAGHSNIRDGSTETIPGHWRCPTCGLLNSWIPKCVSCGAENSEFK